MSVEAKVQQLKEHFVDHDAAHQVETRLRSCFRDGGAFTDPGRPLEGFCFVALGASRSGKSRAIHRALDRIGPRQAQDGVEGRLFEVAVPSPITSKDLALGIVAATTYNVRALNRLTIPEIWRFTHNLLHKMGVDVLFLEEAQNLANCAGLQPAAVGAALKARLQHDTWPISIVLSGDEQIDRILKADPHIRNRTRMVRFRPLAPSEGLPLLSKTLADYLDMAGLVADPGIRTRDFAERLMVACEGLFAFACEHIVRALSLALRNGDRAVSVQHFAEVYRERDGCNDERNVFLADRFHALRSDPGPETRSRRPRRA